MTQAKLAFQVGQISFSGEGSEEWVAKQLDHFLSKMPEISCFVPRTQNPSEPEKSLRTPATPAAVGSLASHIKGKGGESNQVKRFLATADWLRLKGEKNLSTGLVSKALQDNHQKRLANAAMCLNRNVGQGYCEKTASGFYISPEGLQSLGYDPFGEPGAPTDEGATGEEVVGGIATTDQKPKRKKRPAPPPGASCRDRINKLKADGFFKGAKATGDIVEGLGKKGWTHNAPQVGAALTIMFNKDEIQRTKDGGSFKYYWDRD